MTKKKRKKARKSKQKKGFVSYAVIILLLLIIIGVPFLGSESGKQFVSDIKEGRFFTSITYGGDTPDEAASQGTQDDNVTAYGDIDRGAPLVEVNFIDVGQGDSALLKTPSGQFILVDAGPLDASGALLKFLEDRSVQEIEYLVLSHPHADHTGGAREVLYEYKVNNIIMPGVSTGGAGFEKTLAAISAEKEQGCTVYSAAPGDTYAVDGCSVQVLGPYDIDITNLNNCSVIVKFSYKDFSALFTGDTEAVAEKKLIENGTDFSCDVLKVSHHGSSEATCRKFLDTAKPLAAFISCGAGNVYGHPHSEVLSRLDERNIPYFVTAKRGNIGVKSDGAGFIVECEK